MSFISDILQERNKKENYNPDGTMKPHYREDLRSNGWSESEIEATEAMQIRKTINAREIAEWQKELKRQIAVTEAQEEEERKQRAEQLGIPYKPLSTSNQNKLPRQTRAQKMAGLDREELLSQGFFEPDDFYSPSDEVLHSAPKTYARPDVEPPDIEF